MKTSFKYAMFASIGSILLSLLIFIAGMDKTDTGQYLNYLSIVILIIAMVYAIRERRDKEMGGFISFKDAFKTTFVLSVTTTAITSIYSFFYMKYINPGFVDYIIQKQMEKMESQGMSSEQIDAAMKMSAAWMTPGMMVIWTVVAGVFFGLIIALIVSAIMKKPNPEQIS